MSAPSFLADLTLRQIQLPTNCPVQAVGLALGKGASGLEVLVTAASTEPRLPAVRSVWKDRQGGRAAPLLLVVLHQGKATICGPAGDDPPVFVGLDVGQSERLCREALEQPDRHAALRCLRDALPAVESRLPGLRNEGFLATHELAVGARRLLQWSVAGQKAKGLLGQRGDSLLRALGFNIERCDQVTSILRTADQGKRVALAVLLEQSESPELEAVRFSGMSPVAYALSVADRENLPFVLVTQGSKLRLYPVSVGVGVGRRGRSETFVEIHLGLLRDEDAAYLWLLFSGEALKEGGSLAHLLEESKRFAGNLAERLRERIYFEVIPRLAMGLATARGLKKPTAQDLAETYEMAMTVLFRLLFIAYAEDKDLLPYKWNGLYRSRSLKTKATELLELQLKETPFDEGNSLWEEVNRLFRAVDKSNREWGIPEYNGGLFSSDPEVTRVGDLLTQVTLPNTVVGPVLLDLLTIPTDGARGPVDFRSLGVREFGTIYEGLLESELSVAETDLAVDREGYYRPCKAGEQPLVKKNRIYLHNRSGARKSTGTYFTKPFAVEHLLDQALEPALADHLARLDKLDDDTAGERFFDFRVADIAMGSGHFLVAAVDRIERAFTQYLSRRSLSEVRHELAKLRQAACEALGSLAEQVELEDTQLLRRLIARRCIYGVDLNPVAVNLARVSLWIHTFVPGLPLSLLDHNLVQGNSLVGIGRLKEIEEMVQAEYTDPARRDQAQPLGMFKEIDPVAMLGEALEPLKRLARIADATAVEVKKARQAMGDARKATQPAEALCDIATANRMKSEGLGIDVQDWPKLKRKIVGSKEHQQARKTLAGLAPLHFPIAFPEVFLRERAGFDVILGNPPWEEATLEEHAFWARQVPGLRGLSQRQQENLKAQLREERPDLVALYAEELQQADAMRKALTTGPYPGMGTGDPDVYKAFCWRFWRLLAPQGGWLGVVLPRSAWNAKGSTEFRVEVFSKAYPVDLCVLLNTKGWVFDEAEPRYTISLVGVRQLPPTEKSVRIRGPFASLERFIAGKERPPAEFASAEIATWTDTSSLPLLPTEESLEIFAQMRKAPRLDLNDGVSWRARPHRELDATNDKELFDVESEDCPKGFWPVYKGESFDIWEPDTGRYYAWADPEKVLPVLQRKRERGGRTSSSPFSEFDKKRLAGPTTLPCVSPRIAFRDVTNRTNQRTVVVALVPGKVFIANQAPYLLWPRGRPQDEAYLLGILSSVPLDWYSRRFVETHVNFYVFNPFPIPRPDEHDILPKRIIELAGRLACPDKRFAKWAEAVGVECGPLPEDQKQDHIHELDAVVAHLYGLEEKHLIHIFETFHEGWDYAHRLKATLKHFREWKKRR